MVVGGQFGSLPLILPRFCPDQTILIIAFDPKHRFSHLLYSAIHIHSDLKRFLMATKKVSRRWKEAAMSEVLITSRYGPAVGGHKKLGAGSRIGMRCNLPRSLLCFLPLKRTTW